VLYSQDLTSLPELSAILKQIEGHTIKIPYSAANFDQKHQIKKSLDFVLYLNTKLKFLSKTQSSLLSTNAGRLLSQTACSLLKENPLIRMVFQMIEDRETIIRLKAWNILIL
jgi:hypothetical protein